MKKILAIGLFLASVTAFQLKADINYRTILKEPSEAQIDSLMKIEFSEHVCAEELDTTIILNPVLCPDSTKVVEIINGVATVATVFNPEAGGIIRKFGNWIAGGLLIFFGLFCRKKEKDSLKRRGLLKDDPDQFVQD